MATTLLRVMTISRDPAPGEQARFFCDREVPKATPDEEREAARALLTGMGFTIRSLSHMHPEGLVAVVVRKTTG